MSKTKQLKSIAKRSGLMGDYAYRKYKNHKGIEYLKASVSAYNVTLKAIKYQILYRSKKLNSK